jgi:hypothetical protein
MDVPNEASSIHRLTEWQRLYRKAQRLETNGGTRAGTPVGLGSRAERKMN